jgi:hypothetical protein
MNISAYVAQAIDRVYPKTVGDCPDLAVPWERAPRGVVGTVPFSGTVLG